MHDLGLSAGVTVQWKAVAAIGPRQEVPARVVVTAVAQACAPLLTSETEMTQPGRESLSFTAAAAATSIATRAPSPRRPASRCWPRKCDACDASVACPHGYGPPQFLRPHLRRARRIGGARAPSRVAAEQDPAQEGRGRRADRGGRGRLVGAGEGPGTAFESSLHPPVSPHPPRKPWAPGLCRRGPRFVRIREVHSVAWASSRGTAPPKAGRPG
jgi:hypothetical protein